MQLPGLRDCLSVYSGGTAFDLNAVPVPVMVSIGVPPMTAQAIEAMRMIAPIVELQMPKVNQLLGPLSGDSVSAATGSIHSTRLHALATPLARSPISAAPLP